MELLDYIKAVEAEVAGEVEKTRLDSGREVNGFREDCRRKAELKVSQVLKESEIALAKDKANAEKEASLILEKAEKEIIQIKSQADKNSQKAVQFILKKLGG